MHPISQTLFMGQFFLSKRKNNLFCWQIVVLINKVESFLNLTGLTDRCLKKQDSIKKIFEFTIDY